MKFQKATKKIKGYFVLLCEFFQMDKIEVSFKCQNKRELGVFRNIYNNFNKPHRLLLFKHKTIGVCLIDLRKYKDFEDYYKSINGKNSAAYYSRKAGSRGYKFVEIDRNNHIEEIHNINVSANERQGKQMEESYLEKMDFYKDRTHYKYYGVLNKNNQLLAYCDTAFYGGFAQISRLLGHKEFLNDGIMYFMIVEIIKIIFEQYYSKGCNHIMYDTYFGATDGLRMFKNKLAFRPYFVTWLWE